MDHFVLNSTSLGVMGSLLWKLNMLLHTQDGAKGIWQLRDDVVSIRTKLVELSVVHDPPLTVNCWTKDVRELSYDMEDCVDQFILADSDAKMDWADEISGFRVRVEEVMERYHRFKLEYVLGQPITNNVSSHRLGMVCDSTNPVALVGMEGPTNELRGWLKPKGDGENELQLKVVSILGVQGIGKSTLAQELWRIIGEDFECQAFVKASKKPDMRTILKSVLLQVRQHQPQEACCQVPKLINDISKHLQNKRYFIIIDDIWAVSIWDTISRAFPEGNCCSRILTTTTIQDVALACCSYNPEHIFKMKYLSCDHSKELFSRTVFGSAKGYSQKFQDTSDEIAIKCGGLPLAITCIASLVASQPKTAHQWDYVSNLLCHNLRTHPTSMEILKEVLNLCYGNLSHCLKTCLLYLSVYPENYIILKDDLVKQWIAEDFICATEEKNIVEVASSCFDKLVSLGMIQQMNIGGIKKGRSYVVHPTVFDFITCKSIEENFITTIDYSQSTIVLTEKVRRLSLHFGSATYATTPASIEQLHVRSLSFMGLLNCMPTLEGFKLVRVIILHVLSDNRDTNFPLTGIRELLLLRYLLVRCNVTVDLPDQIGYLKHLETLEIHARVTAVPSDIVHLRRLLHLRLGRKRYRYHTHLILNYLPAGNALSFDDSSRAFFHPIPIFEFPGMIPRAPRWIEHFGNLFYLDVVVRELQTYDINALAELPALRVFMLYVRTPTARDIHFRRGAFPALMYFRYMCAGVLLLTFDQEAMPNLCRFNVGFNAHRGGVYGHMLAGIQHLSNLQKISARIGAAFNAEESDMRSAESTFLDAISKHPCLRNFKVKRFDRVNGEYDDSEKPNWIKEIEFSNELDEVPKKEHVAFKENMVNDQHGVVGKMPGEDMNKHADTRDEEHQTQWLEKSSPLLPLLATLVATVTYYAGLNPPAGLWQYHADCHQTRDPILLTMSPGRYKAFFCCNSVAFVFSLFTIILLKNGDVLEHKALEATMIMGILGLMGAHIAGRDEDMSTPIYDIMSWAGFVLVYVAIYTVLLTLKPTGINWRSTHRKVKEALLEKMRNCLLLAFQVVITYQLTLSPPSQFWNESGLHASDAPLLLYNHLLRYEQTIYWRLMGSIMFPTVVILACPIRNRPAGQSNVIFFVGMAVGMSSPMVVYAFASTQHEKTLTSAFLLQVAIFLIHLGRVLMFTKGKADNSSTCVVENNITSNHTAPETEECDSGMKRMVQGFLAAIVTFHAFLALLLGGVWQGGSMGNPMKQDSRRLQYLTFLYSNSFSFVASIVVVVLLLLQLLHDNKWWLRVTNMLIVLDFLSLLVAYVAGSYRSLKITEYVAAIIVSVLVYFAIRVMLSFFSRRSKTPAAASFASHAN